jgi:hypothetical protein
MKNKDCSYISLCHHYLLISTFSFQLCLLSLHFPKIFRIVITYIHFFYKYFPSTDFTPNSLSTVQIFRTVITDIHFLYNYFPQVLILLQVPCPLFKFSTVITHIHFLYNYFPQVLILLQVPCPFFKLLLSHKKLVPYDSQFKKCKPESLVHSTSTITT